MPRHTYTVDVNNGDWDLTTSHPSVAKAYAHIHNQLLPNVAELGITSIVVFEDRSLYERVYPQSGAAGAES